MRLQATAARLALRSQRNARTIDALKSLWMLEWGDTMSLHREYKGFEINAYGQPAEGGFTPVVVLARHNAKDVAERKFDVPCDNVLADEDEAMRLAMEYGLDAVDGNVKGFDPATFL